MSLTQNLGNLGKWITADSSGNLTFVGGTNTIGYSNIYLDGSNTVNAGARMGVLSTSGNDGGMIQLNVNNGFDFWFKSSGSWSYQGSLSKTGSLVVNGTLGINGTSNNITSGTYTPSFGNCNNLTSCTHIAASYIRIGNTVIVYGTATIQFSATGDSCVYISIPVSTTNTFNNGSVYGTGTLDMGTSPKLAGIVYGAGSTYNAYLRFTNTDTAAHTMAYTFSYQVT